MTDPGVAHDMVDLAVLYALGALPLSEAQIFEEHLASGCNICNAELESFELTVQNMGFSAFEESPPARIRETLLASLHGRAEGSDEKRLEASERLLSVLSSEGIWCELMNGVLVKTLFVDPDSGVATSLVRMLPGTSLPVHKHLGVEQFFVLEGDCNVAGQTLGQGDYHRAEKGCIHHSTYTVNGTLFLLIAPELYAVLDGH